MSWRDRIGDGTAEFRGVTLYLERGSISPGRRVEVHEYPLRDEPYAEDLGRQAREWQVTGYLVGDDYDIQRNRLADALEIPGAAEMRHSYYGTHRVVVVDARISESTREGGMARVSLRVVRADDDPRYPTAIADTQAVVAEAGSAARLAILDDFEASFDLLGLAADRVDAIETTIFNALSGIERVVGDVSGTIARFIRTPVELGAAILDTIAGVADRLGEPGRALRLYNDLYGTGETQSAGYSAPVDAQRQAQAQTAAVHLIRRAAAVESAIAAAEWRYPSRQDAIEALEIVHGGLTDQLAGAVPPLPQTAQRLVALRGAVVQDLRRRGTALPSLSQYTPQARLPALVIAHRLYDDATRDTEIIRRNTIRHPGSVPAGEPLEVLSE